MQLWAFVGLFSGPWKLVIVAVVALVAYGRLGLPRHPLFRLLLPWTSNSSRAAEAPVVPEKTSTRPAWMSDRWFIFTMVLAATALAAWIVTSMTVMSPGLRPPGH